MKYLVLIAIVILESYALADNSGLLKRKYNTGFMGYYTSLSNIVVWIYCFLLLCGINVLDKSIYSFSIMACIMLTFLIYHFILSPLIIADYREGKGWNPYNLVNYSLHYICPLLVFVYWLLFADKSDLSYSNAFIWTILPLTYCLYIFARVKLGIYFDDKKTQRYPYDFMNVDKYGLKRVLINIFIIFVVFMLLGLLLVWFGLLFK